MMQARRQLSRCLPDRTYGKLIMMHLLRLLSDPLSNGPSCRHSWGTALAALAFWVTGLANADISAYYQTAPQALVVEFASTQAAEDAELSIAPLHHDLRLAVCSRWDDNFAEANIETAKRAMALGLKGTFFLNGETRPTRIDGYRQMAKEVVAIGQGVGNHTWSHPMLATQNANRRYEEFARARVLIEQTSDSHVNAIAWPFNRAGNTRCLPQDGGEAQAAECLFRSGHLGHAQSYGLSVNGKNVRPQIGRGVSASEPITRKVIEDVILRIEKDDRDPSIWVFGVHPIHHKDKDFENVKDLAGIPGLWHCTFNEFVAYRFQWAETRMKVDRDGATLRVTLERPLMRDLNDDVPLTFKLTGCQVDEIVSVTSPDADVSPLTPETGEPCLFELHHPRDQQLPVDIGAVHNDDATGVVADPAFAPLRGVLAVKDDQLVWTLENHDGHDLTDIRLTFRLPPVYTRGVVWEQLEMIGAGDRRRGVLDLPDRTDNPREQFGRAFYVLEIDGVLKAAEGRPVRFYMTASERLETPGQFPFPNGGFATLGPIGEQMPDQTQLAGIASGERHVYTTEAGKALAFAPGILPLPANADIMDDIQTEFSAEYIPITGLRSYGREKQEFAATYLCRSEVTSPRARDVSITLSENSALCLYVNGELYDPKEAQGAKPVRFDDVRLRAGKNTLLVVASTRSRDFQALSGLYFRISDAPQSGPIGDIAFRPLISPPLPQ